VTEEKKPRGLGFLTILHIIGGSLTFFIGFLGILIDIGFLPAGLYIMVLSSIIFVVGIGFQRRSRWSWEAGLVFYLGSTVFRVLMALTCPSRWCIAIFNTSSDNIQYAALSLLPALFILRPSVKQYLRRSNLPERSDAK